MKTKYLLLVLPLVLSGCSLLPSKTALEKSEESSETTATESLESGAVPGENTAASAAAEAGVTTELTAENFTFSVTEIRAKKGQKVTVAITNKEGVHDFNLDEFKIKTGMIAAGATKRVEFVADKVGTFEYYCSVGNHRQMGMKGKLIVE